MPLKIALFDMDGTIVQYPHSSYQSSWDAIGTAAGVAERWQEWVKYYIDKPHLYQEWFDKNCSSLKGMAVEPIMRKVLPLPYTPGFIECCQYLREHGAKLGIISNGVDLIAREIAKDVPLEVLVVEEVHTQEGKFTGTGTSHLHIAEKGKKVLEILNQYGIAKEEAAFIGDHFNDCPAWKEVGLPLGVNVKDERCYAHIMVGFSDFYEVLKFFKANS